MLKYTMVAAHCGMIPQVRRSRALNLSARLLPFFDRFYLMDELSFRTLVL